MSDVMEATLRTTLRRAGLFEHATSYLQRVAERYYTQRLDGDTSLRAQVDRLQRLRSLERHYGHTEFQRPHQVLNVSLYLAELTRTVEARLGHDGFDPTRSRLLDVGDPDGLVLHYLGARHGVSVNILDVCVRQITASGGRAVRGDCALLPFADAAFDYVCCFETLEHLENPIAGLKELARLVKRKLYLAIPWVRRTVIREDNHDPKQPEPENHVFEFSHADFLKILTHARLRVSYYHTIAVVPRIVNPVHRLLLERFYFPVNYARYQFFELEKEGQRR